MNQRELERALEQVAIRERALASYRAARTARLDARLHRIRLNRRRHLDELLAQQLDAQHRIPHK